MPQTFVFTPTAGWQFVKVPQYVEETAFEVPPSSPTYIAPGNVMTINPTRDVDVDENRYLGSRDLKSQIQLGMKYAIEFEYKPSDITLMKYGTEYPASTGTNAKSLSFVWSRLLNGAEKFIEVRGAVCDKISFSISRKGGVSCTQSWMAKSISNYLTAPASPVTTPTYASTPVTTPWSGITTSTTPVTINAVSYPASEFKFDVSQNPVTIDPIGTPSFDFAGPGNRDVTLSFTTWSKDGTLIDDLTNFTARSVSLTLAVVAGVTYTATFGNVKFNSYKTSDSAGANEFKMETFDAKAETITLTSST
jgi:hypothetical protein